MGICTVFFTTFPSLPYKCAPIWTCVCACMRAWNWTNDRPTGNAYVQPDLRRHVWCRHIHSDSLSDLFSPSKSTNTSTLLPIAPPSWSTHRHTHTQTRSLDIFQYTWVIMILSLHPSALSCFSLHAFTILLRKKPLFALSPGGWVPGGSSERVNPSRGGNLQ